MTFFPEAVLPQAFTHEKTKRQNTSQLDNDPYMCFFVILLSGGELFYLISWTETQHELLRARDKQKQYGGPIIGGQDGLPLLLLSLLSHQLPETHLLPDLHPVVCVRQQRGDICTPHRAWHQPTLGRRGLGGHMENSCLLERFVSCWSHIGFVLFTCLPLGFLFMFIIPLLSFPF